MQTNNEAAFKAARFAAASAKGKLIAAERKGAQAKATMRAAKAACKKAKKYLKQTRKEAKAARKAIVELRELVTETDQKWRKVQENQARSAATTKTPAASRPARSRARRASFSSGTGNAHVNTSRTSGTVEMPEEHVVVPGDTGVSGGPA